MTLLVQVQYGMVCSVWLGVIEVRQAALLLICQSATFHTSLFFISSSQSFSSFHLQIFVSSWQCVYFLTCRFVCFYHCLHIRVLNLHNWLFNAFCICILSLLSFCTLCLYLCMCFCFLANQCLPLVCFALWLTVQSICWSSGFLSVLFVCCVFFWFVCLFVCLYFCYFSIVWMLVCFA